MSEKQRKFETFEASSFSRELLDELEAYLKKEKGDNSVYVSLAKKISDKIYQQIQNYPEEKNEILSALKDVFEIYKKMTTHWDTNEIDFLEGVIENLPIETNDFMPEKELRMEDLSLELEGLLKEHYKEFNESELIKMANLILQKIKEYPEKKITTLISLMNACLVERSENANLFQIRIDVLMKIIEMAQLNFPEKTTKEVKKENEVVSGIQEGRKSLSEFFIEAPENETGLNQLFRHSYENVAKYKAKHNELKYKESSIHLEEVVNRLTNEIENANTVDEKKSILSAVANAFERNDLNKDLRNYDEALKSTIVNLDIKYSKTDDHENLHWQLTRSINQYLELKTSSPKKSDAIIDKIADKIIQRISNHPSEKKVIIFSAIESAIIECIHNKPLQDDLLSELETSALERVIERAPLKKSFLKEAMTKAKDLRKWFSELFDRD